MEFVKRLAAAGWKIKEGTLSKIETEGARANHNRNWPDKQIKAISTVTGYSLWVCYFWIGRLPLNLADLDENTLADTRIEVGMATLFAAIGRAQDGPPVTPELAQLLRLNDPPTPEAEFQRVRQSILSGQVNEKHMDVVREMGETLREERFRPDHEPGGEHSYKDPLEHLWDD